MARPFSWVGRTRKTPRERKAERDARKAGLDAPDPIWQSRFGTTHRAFVARLQQDLWPRLSPEEVRRLRPSDIAAISGTHELDEILREYVSPAQPHELTAEERARVYSKRGTGDRPRLRAVR